MMRERASTRAERPTRWGFAIALGAVIGAIAVWWRASDERVVTAGARTSLSSPAAAPARSAGARAEPLLSASAEAGDSGGAGTEDPVAAYRKVDGYPPTSQPLSRDQVDLLHPNQRREVMREAEHGDGVTYLFTADRASVIGDETLTATLDVRRDGKRIAANVVGASFAVRDPAARTEHPIEISFVPSGDVLASTIAPAKLSLERQSTIGVDVEFDHGDGRQRAHIDFQYAPSTGIPAQFTGLFRDAIEGGSLVIHASVEVASAGQYVIDANLFDADDQPVAWARFQGDLVVGSQDAALVFFGKIIVDALAHGPFHIGQLRGARRAPGRDPGLEQMPPFTGSFTTGPYATFEFSDAPSR